VILGSFAERLLDWFDREQRDLPWRHTSDPWAIWVSEIMLQQTRVEVVRQLYPRFMERFGTPADLADVTDDQLLAGWKGLGYYRRARLLRQGAQRVVEEFEGRVPDDPATLRDLPGIGPYTAGAIASIAFGHPVIAVDGNVERVAARHRGIETDVKSAPAAGQIREIVADWLAPARAGDFNQALMELGAVVCTPRSPSCNECPVAADCVGRERGIQDLVPVLPKRRRVVEVQARAVLVPVSGGRILGSRIPEGLVNAGQIDLPGPGALITVPTVTELEDELRRLYGVSFEAGEVITTVSHGITHHRIQLRVHRAQCARGPGPNLMAARPDDVNVPWTTIARKAFHQAALFLAAQQ